eukprot:SAG22_NODE_5068_length_1092_cov_1.901309_2_plen_187_part_01
MTRRHSARAESHLLISVLFVLLCLHPKSRATSVAGIGIDIVHSCRVGALHDRYGERFLRRAYHPAEAEEFRQRAATNSARGAEFLASRWAAKEAIYKALSSAAAAAAAAPPPRPESDGGHGAGADAGRRRPLFNELHIVSGRESGGGGGSGGGPRVELSGRAADVAAGIDIGTIEMSMAHEADYAVA